MLRDRYLLNCKDWMIHFRSDRLIKLLTLVLSLGLFLTAASTVTAKELRLSWDDNSEPNIAGYKVYCRLAHEDYDYDRPAWDGSENSCVIDSLEDNTNYYFIVRAYNTFGDESEDSEEVEYDYESNSFIAVNIDGYGTTSLTAGLNGTNGSTGGGGSCFIDAFLSSDSPSAFFP